MLWKIKQQCANLQGKYPRERKEDIQGQNYKTLGDVICFK